jgi:salicylate 5-hydroxylase small subunit
MLASQGVSLERRVAIEELYATYVHLLDAREYEPWINLFTEECVYIVKSRENEERHLPLSLLAFESKGMLRDRIYGITNTLFHEPYYQRHVVSSFVIRRGDDGSYQVNANYVVVRTKVGDLTQLYSAGAYRDRIVEEDRELRFAEKRAIYDSELIPNSLIYPI